MASISKLNPNSEQVLDDLVRCETRLYNALSEALRAEYGLTFAQFEFMRYLQRSPGSRVADLATCFAVGVGATSKGIDRLEQVGFVQRIANPNDRRSSLLQLTTKGQKEVLRSRKVVDRHLFQLIESSIGIPAFQSLADVLHLLRVSLEKDGIGTPAG